MQILSWVPLAVCTSMLVSGSQKALAQEAVCQKHHGITQCRQGVLPQLHASGIVHIEKTQIDGLCNVKGQFSINQAVVQTLHAYGQGEILGTKITGKSKIYGKATVVNSQIDKECQVWSNSFNLQNSQAATIKMHVGSAKEGQIVIESGSTVTGDIVFTEGPGVVVLKEGAHLAGKVKNGRIEGSQQGGY